MKLLIPVISLLLVICGSALKANACLQPIGRDVVGEKIRVDGVSAQEFIKNLTTHQDRAYWIKVRNDIENQGSSSSLFEYRNNLAVALIHLGQVKDAIAILEELERRLPGQYSVAANLGTAYELNGENQKALEWIKEGVKRKPESHFGTEWLHVKILEAKIAIEQDPEWLDHHSVLGTEFGTSEKQPASELFTTDYLGQRKFLTEIKEALVYQLHERLEFIKPPEPVVAGLLVDLSKVLDIWGTSEHARVVNNLALDYGAKAKENQKISGLKSEGSYLFYGILGIIIVLTAGVFYAFIRKRIYR